MHKKTPRLSSGVLPHAYCECPKRAVPPWEPQVQAQQ